MHITIFGFEYQSVVSCRIEIGTVTAGIDNLGFARGDTRLLRLEKARQYIELVVNVEDLRKDTGSVATNPIIQAYVKEKYGFYVHSLYIAQVRDKLGIKLHESANKVAQPKRKVSICPDYKEAAILEAFHHYGVYRA